MGKGCLVVLFGTVVLEWLVAVLGFCAGVVLDYCFC